MRCDAASMRPLATHQKVVGWQRHWITRLNDDLMSRDIAGYGYSSSRLASTRAELSSAQFSSVQFISVWATHSTVGSCRACPKETERKIRQREIERERGGRWGDGEREWKWLRLCLAVLCKKKNKKKVAARNRKKKKSTRKKLIFNVTF